MNARFFRAKGDSGFTLLELVIVLGITGLIFGGLWGLISGGSGQLQAQTAAQQYRQVIEASRRLLSPGVTTGSGPGLFDPTTWPAGSHDGTTPGTAKELPLSVLTDPSVALLGANFAQAVGGNYFDAFGHQMRVAAQRMDDSTTKWRFMVYSTPVGGTPIINDKIGAQVASLIGSEGGFVYTAVTEGCTTAGTTSTTTCGSYNAFAFLLSKMGVASGSGRIATLSFTSDNSTIGAPWLMRIPAPSLTDFNTMSAPLDFKSSAFSLTMRGSPIFLNDGSLSAGSSLSSTTSAGKITLNGGTLSMGADGANNAGGILNMATGRITNVGGPSSLGGDVTGANPTFAFNSFTLNSTTSIDATPGGGLSFNVNCPSAFLSAGNCTVPVLFSINGLGRADTFQAKQFIYTSDMRLKENIRRIPNALDKVLQLRGVDYQWRSNHAQDMGLVAQEVEKVFPELVSKTPDGVRGIDYARVVAPLIEAIRQLKEDNDSLRAKVDAMQVKYDNGVH